MDLVNKLAQKEEYKHQTVKQRWIVALQMIKNNEY